jgi:hypothetical protein
MRRDILELCFSAINDPGLGGGRGRRSHESALRSGWVKHTANLLNATKPDRSIVSSGNGLAILARYASGTAS